MKQRGVSLLLAVIFLSIALAITLGIFYVVFVQLQLNRSAKDSHLAFFAADTGVECALWYQYRQGIGSSGGYWNPQNPCLSGGASCGPIACVDQTSIPVVYDPGPPHLFSFSINSGGICADVLVTSFRDKYLDSDGEEVPYFKVFIESRGKSTCAGGSNVVNRTVSYCDTSGPNNLCP